MSIAAVVDALALPPDARVDQRIPKKLLVEQGAPTAADKRQIQDGIEELQWIAALKPTNIGVPLFRDAEREYLEVAILTATYRSKARVARLTELIHRAIPYPVLLVSSFIESANACIAVSAAHKRFAQNEAGKVVVDEIMATVPIDADTIQTTTATAFLDAMALSKQPTRDLFALYQGWIDCIVGFLASNITGRFTMFDSVEQTGQMWNRIAQHLSLMEELSALRTQAAKEKQMNRRVDLNLKIKQLETKLAAIQTALRG